MRRRPTGSDVVDLSRVAQLLGPEARAYLDTSRGFPTHRAVSPAIAAQLKAVLRHPDPAVRRRGLDCVRRLIVGPTPSPQD